MTNAVTDTSQSEAMEQRDYKSLAECLSVLGEIARGDLTANRMKSRAINVIKNHEARKAVNTEAAE